MSDTSKPNPLFVKKGEAKKGELWHQLANQRFHKQHQGGEIPEGDHHAVPRYHSPLDERPASPEETQATLADLETQIKVLKEKEKHKEVESKAPEEPKSYNYEDDWYD